MAKTKGDELKRHEKVAAAIDLPGVPEGTLGKISYVAGVSWIRYRVLFDNGVERGQIRREWLRRRNEAPAPA